MTIMVIRVSQNQVIPWAVDQVPPFGGRLFFMVFKQISYSGQNR